MSDVKRYWMESEGPCGSRIESDESTVQVVLASDYDELRAERDELRGQLDNWMDSHANLQARVDELTAALESADQKLSGIHLYSQCKTSRAEAALIRRDIKAALKVTP